jgi:YVTN family beta-propeller protein
MVAAAGVLLAAAAAQVQAQVLVIGTDEKATWNDAGQLVNHPPGKDKFVVVDIADRENPKIAGEIALNNSVVGPPTNLAVLPSGDLALIASSIESKKDGDAWKPGPDTKLHLIDIKANPPAVVSTIDVGKQPSGIAVDPRGGYALVANRADNSVSVVAIDGKSLKLAETVPVGDSVAGIALTPDARLAFAIKPTINRVAVLKYDAGKLTYDKHDMTVGVFPYNVDVAPGGKIALTANNGFAGGSDGNADTVSVIDVEADPPRVADFVTVGDGPEGLTISPKGGYAAVALLRGSNSDKKAFFYNKNGSVVLLKIDGKNVTRLNEVEVGGLPEGMAFSPDGAYLYVGNFLDSDLWVLKVEGDKLVDTGKRLKLPGRPASLRGSVG